MKKIVLLFIASLIVSASMGQMSNKNTSYFERQAGLEALEGMNPGGMNLMKYQLERRTQFSSVHQSAQGVKQQLDSTIYKSATGPYTFSRIIYNYDASGNKIRERKNEIMSNLHNLEDTKYEYVFNTNGNQTQISTYNWDKILNLYVGSVKVDSIYDSNGDAIQFVHYKWDLNVNQWVGNYKGDKTFNSFGKETRCLYYHWNQINNQWVISSKIESAYDLKGNQTENISLKWDENATQWVNNTKEESIYDENNNLIKYSYFQWNTSLNSWDYIEKHEYTFSLQELLTKDIRFIGNGYGGWRVLSQWDYTNDSNGNIIQRIGSWDRLDIGQLFIGTKDEKRYDSNENCTQINSYRWSEQFNQWERSDSTAYYYSDVETSISAPVSSIQAKCFPNPASKYITFDIKDAGQSASVELIDIQGKKVVSQSLPQNKQIQVNQLKSGMYFYRIQQGDKIVKGKVAIK